MAIVTLNNGNQVSIFGRIVRRKYPKRQKCFCGATMDFISIEFGYSCRNKGCCLHMHSARSY